MKLTKGLAHFIFRVLAHACYLNVPAPREDRFLCKRGFLQNGSVSSKTVQSPNSRGESRIQTPERALHLMRGRVRTGTIPNREPTFFEGITTEWACSNG